MSAVLHARAHRNVSRFLRDDGGSSLIEFAILAPLSFILILATIEFGLDMMVDATVQIAAQQASRAGLTTSAPASGTRDQQAQNLINNMLGGWTNIGATITINTLTYGTYSNVGTSNYQSSMGNFGDVVSYNITLTMPPITGIPRIFGVNQLTFQRNYIVQNEK
ncbi:MULTISPECIES: TadE/TadG family type IV pilus assembly protein [unclassified Caballeronia]|uniref:TadE/TadG family type IV pilus assembly protein n=1 Tax=unclassified Caballeronia TaxID=2646786 RepID=UPI0020282DC3|nr:MULTISPECIES: TadE/TadG family type IV pilus assembly protein [unclassified Caballeronia]MDR5800708.1 pilus assembly protein [Caballeronia sp. LZ001]